MRGSLLYLTDLHLCQFLLHNLTECYVAVRLRAQLLTKSPQMCTQDLENLCSGEFTSQATQELEDNQETEVGPR